MVVRVMRMKKCFEEGGSGKAIYGNLLDEEQHAFISVVVMAEQ